MTARRTIRWGASLLAVLGVWAALGAEIALAVPVTVGQLFAPNYACDATSGNITFLQDGVLEGASYKIPTDGAITSWSFYAGASVLPNLKLKVARPGLAAGEFTVIGQSTAGSQTAGKVNTFPVSIPVKEKDRIGIYPGGSGPCLGKSGSNSDVTRIVSGDAPLNSPVIFSFAGEYRIPLSVTVQPPPTLTSMSPSSGDPAGGTKVTIAGEDFTGASAVSFGPAPATAFAVNSDTQITAFSPTETAGTVEVRVTTPAGQSALTSGDQFTFAVPAGPPAPTTPTVAAAASGPTGKRAAALKKCKSKHGKAKKRCQKRAKKLPV